MALISTRLHGALDYAGGVASLAAPRVLGDRRAAALLALTGAGTLATSAFTDYELGIRRRLPMPAHLAADALTGAMLLGGAVALRRRRAGLLDCAPLVLVGITEIAAAALTERQPADRRQAEAASAPSAPAPTTQPERPPTPAREKPEPVDIDAARRAAEATDDPLVAREASAAAAAAARIGGVVEPETGDPAMDPVYQAGGGEQEGWEQAEAELIENATHGDGHGSPEHDAFAPEPESDRAGAVYGDADHVTRPGE